MKRKIIFSLLAILVALPSLVLADGLVPCGGPGEPVCQLCYWVDQVNLVTKWLVGILSVIFSIIIIVTGIKLVTSAGNVAEKSAAKSRINNAFIGFVIVLAAWLLVDFIMQSLVNQGAYGGPWNTVSCVDQPESRIVARTTASQDNLSSFTESDVENRVNGVNGSTDVAEMANDAAGDVGLTDDHEKIYRALLSQESSNCKNKVGPPTPYGQAYGCSQMLVPTAREVDKLGENRFSGKSNSEVAEILRNDDAYSIALGSVYFNQKLKKYNGNVDYALASYNGGDKALQNSTVCPGQLAYQCEKNKGYAQTRNYVSNIKKVAAKL